MTDALTEMLGAAGAVTPHEVSRVDTVVFAAYGTTRARARTAAIEPAFRAVADAVDVPCELAFSGPAVCRLLARRGEDVPELERVLEQVADAGARRVAAAGARRVAVVSGMVVDGWAQANLRERVGVVAERLGLKVVVGVPLLSDATDVDCLAAALMGEWRPKPGTVTLFVGHGIGGPAGSGYTQPRDAFDAYGALGAAFAHAGRDDLAVACLSDGPDAALQVVRGLAEPGATVRLVPLMLAAGRHVLKNMGGADDCSWASILSAAGYAPQLCDCGLGEVAAVQELFARHARALCATNE